MQLIRCTAKLRKELGVKDSALYQGDAPKGRLGPWHAHLIYIHSRKCVLFVNDKTLFNFIAPDVSRAQIRDPRRLFLDWLYPVLGQEAYSPEECDALAAEYDEIQIAKSSSKSVLGSMNEFAFSYEFQILRAGSVHSHEVPSIIHEANRMPMSALKYLFPATELRRLVREKTE